MIELEFFNKSIINHNRKNFKGKFCGVDNEKYCLDKEWFKNYPVQNFDYSFNSWGFRGEEYEKYIGKSVILCLGDSITTNIGGPIEHSWPSLLQKYFQIPCLNFGMEKAGNDAIKLVYEHACKIFDVKECFVVYSYFDRRLENGKFTSTPHDHNDNIKYFEKNFINNTFYQFIPFWFTDDELNYIHSNHKNKPIDYGSSQYWLDGFDRKWVQEKEYNMVKGLNWESYKDFLSGNKPHNDILSQTVKLPLNTMFMSNRDGKHLNLMYNKNLTDNLYRQYLEKNNGS